MKKFKTVVLTSRQNFVWLSMQEIIPLIQKNWKESGAPGEHEVICKDVDQYSLSELMPDLLSADNIVFTCFTIKLCKIGELLRKNFGLDARYFIYLHNQATIACWPFHVWGMGEFLREDDVFISTSTADRLTFKHSFENARVEIIPFTIPGLKPERAVPKPHPTEIPFVYVGRLSAQKNLHTLIYAFRLFCDANPSHRGRLVIYGKDDNLGSPNMGMTSKSYGKSLKKLSGILGLKDRVDFKGYRNRAHIQKSLNRWCHVSVSASLHSDENFGMAQFNSISKGNLAVLTRWGGYADFRKNFGSQVFLAPVEEASRGPWVDPVKFAMLLGQAAESYRKREFRSAKIVLPDCYQEKNISAALLKLATEGSQPKERLAMTSFAQRILKKRLQFKKSPRSSKGTQIFQSYADADAKILFKAYGMSRSIQQWEVNRAGVRCFPWVDVKAHSLLIRDPHRGDFELPLKENLKGSTVPLKDWYGQTRQVSRKTASRLVSLGVSHPLLKEEAVKDLCQPSLNILRDKCIQWFERKGIRGPLHFPDCLDQEDSLFAQETSEPINVIFFGQFLNRFLESGNWTAREYRFWVLCESTKDVLTRLMGVPVKKVGLIPRYELYPSSKKPRKFPKIGEAFTLVFGGRLSPTKNIELLLKTVSHLQTKKKIPVRLLLSGRFDNEQHMDRNIPPDFAKDYRQRVLRLIATSSWTVPPKLIHDRGPDQWHRGDLLNPVFVGLSTFIGEDFGVSVAQAQELGWPCLLSDWGSHRDVTGPGVRKIPFPLVGVTQTKELVDLRAREISSLICDFLKNPNLGDGRKILPTQKILLPETVKRSELDSLRRGLVEKIGRLAPLICRGNIRPEESEASLFFSKYRQLFAGSAPDSECLVLINNLGIPQNPVHAARKYQSIQKEASKQGLKVTFVLSTDIFQSDTFPLLLRAKKVVVPFFTEEMRPIAQFLKNELSF